MGIWVDSGLTTNLTVLQTGIYCINNYDGKITDAPFGGVFGIIVSKVDNNFVFQLAFGMDGIKHRQCEIGNWSEWE